MSRDEFCAANRRNWDERVAIHGRDATGFYGVERFLAGEKRLHAIDSGELGEIAGKRLIHLQCHFGLDTLILAREGAVVTGLDFSAVAIAEAKRLAAKIGVPADFVCADVYDARQAVKGEFDIVFTTWGTICWLPDIVGWGETIASLLAPGGVFYFADAHPAMLVLEEREGCLVAESEADTPIDKPLVFDEAQTYTGDPTPLAAVRTYQWIHSLPRIVSALTGAGLVLDFVHEHSWLPWPPFPMCIRNDSGAYCLPKGAPPLPLAVSLRAIKARISRTL
jgi:SAM-dependent methyltransferase